MSPKSVTCLHGFKNISFNLLYTQDVQTVSWKKKKLCMKEKTHFNKYKTKQNKKTHTELSKPP